MSESAMRQLSAVGKQFPACWRLADEDCSVTPSQACKSVGLDSLAELERITKRGNSTLLKWYHEQPNFFEIVVLGAAQKKKENKGEANE